MRCWPNFRFQKILSSYRLWSFGRQRFAPVQSSSKCNNKFTSKPVMRSWDAAQSLHNPGSELGNLVRRSIERCRVTLLLLSFSPIDFPLWKFNFCKKKMNWNFNFIKWKTYSIYFLLKFSTSSSDYLSNEKFLKDFSSNDERSWEEFILGCDRHSSSGDGKAFYSGLSKLQGWSFYFARFFENQILRRASLSFWAFLNLWGVLPLFSS